MRELTTEGTWHEGTWRRRATEGAAALLLAALASGCARPLDTGSEDPPGAAPQPGARPQAGVGAPAGATALTRSFPAHAARVVGRGGGLALTAGPDGFVAASDPRQGAALQVTLPANGGESARFQTGTLDIHVREEGAGGEGTIVERAVAYPRAGGTSFWTVGAAGAEEWLHLAAGAVREGEAAAAWVVEGAALEAHGDAIALKDREGAARIWVTAPEAYAVDGRSVGVHLRVSGSRIELHVDAEGEEVLVDPGWTVRAPMLAARAAHALVTLPDGKVLAAGGSGQPGGNFLSSAEIFDPSLNTWTAVPAMSAARYAPSAFLLPNGKVLVAGGIDLVGPVTAAQIFDPITKVWSSGGTLSPGRSFMAGTALPGGKIFVAGGYDLGGFVASASLYDPATNAWTALASMASARVLAGAFALPNGKVLVAGGGGGSPQNTTGFATTEIYDVATNTWSPGPGMLSPRWAFASTALPSGKILVAGGLLNNTNSTPAAEVLDPAVGLWVATSPLSVARGGPMSALLGNGTFLVAAGLNGAAGMTTFDASSEVYSEATGQWTPSGSLSAARYIGAAARLPNGDALITGGFSDLMGSAAANTDLYAAGLPLGQPCNGQADCSVGFCTDGVCCAVAACPGPADACHAQGTCSAGTGVCSAPVKPDGTACDDGNACTQMDACEAGACTGGAQTDCVQTDDCHDPGVCDPMTGLCSNPAKPTGTPCDDGNACTGLDKCQNGVCAGGIADCAPLDECHDAGTCDPATGQCDAPVKPDGAPCSNGVCQGGACVGNTSTGGSGGSTGGSGAGGSTGGSTGGSGGSGAGGASGGSSAGGDGTGGTGTGGDVSVGGGCGCRAAGSEGGSLPGALGLALAALLVARKRRPAPRPARDTAPAD